MYSAGSSCKDNEKCRLCLSLLAVSTVFMNNAGCAVVVMILHTVRALAVIILHSAGSGCMDWEH